MMFKPNKKIYQYFSILIIFSIISVNLISIGFGDQISNSNFSDSLLPKPLADTTPPEFGTNLTKNNGYTGDNFNFSINVTDIVGINDVRVNFTWPGAGQWFNLSMVNNSNIWTNISVMPSINTTITYYFWANDTSDNFNFTGPGFLNIIDNDPPTIISGSGNFTVGSGNGFTIFANFTDNVNVNNATIHYRKITSGSFYSAAMNEGNEGEFSVTNIFLGLDTSTDVTDYFYYVIAKDGNGSSVNYTFNETNNWPWQISVMDDDPPIYSNGTGNFSTFVGTSFIIYANFTDNLGIDNVSFTDIYYRVGTTGNFTSIAMQKNGPGEYAILNSTMGLDTTNNDLDIEYYLWANDTSSNNATYPNGYYFTIKIIDNINPISQNGSGDIIAYCSSGFNIHVNFSDNINVSHALIFFAYEFNNTYQNASMVESINEDGHFVISNTSMDVNIYNSTKNLTYYVIGYDNDNNSAKYNDTGDTDWNITVIDDVAPIPTSGSGDFKAGTGIPFKIWANFTDNINVTRARIYFKLQNSIMYCYFNMTLGDINGSFYATLDNLSQCSNIDTFTSTEPLYYYVHAFDVYNNTGNYSNVTKDWKITIYDNSPPQKLNISGDFTITTGEPFTIYGNFSDNINISHADLYYKRKDPSGSGSNYVQVSMLEDLDEKGHFYITNDKISGLDTYMDDRDIFYYIVVFDKMGLNTTVRKQPYNFDFKITLIDNDKPWLHSGNGNFTIGTGDNFNVYGNFSDNIEIDFVRLYYRKESLSTWEYQDFSVDDGNNDNVWEFHISSNDLEVPVDTTNDDLDFYYYIEVYDSYKKAPNILNYSIGTQGFKITVIDDDAPQSFFKAGSGNFIATTGEPFFIYANFTDNIKVDFAKIYLKNLSETSNDIPWPNGINMTESVTKSGRFYISNEQLNIDTTFDDSDYEYYVECQDTSGNGFVYSAEEDSFIIEVIDNDKPIASAGPNRAIEVGTTVHLNADASFDNIKITSYSWEFTYEKLLRTLKGVTADFTFNYPEMDYNIILTIRDEQGNMAKDYLWVNVSEKNYPPIIKDYKPKDGEKIYAIESIRPEISVQFNETILINEKDINNIDFFYLMDASGTHIEGTYSWNEFYLKLLFTPNSQLGYDGTYTATVTTNVTDLTGKHLENGLTWTFYTHPEDSEEDGLGDNLPDWWEIQHFGSINEVGPSDDDDNDGFTNLEEYNAKTDPNNKRDHPEKDEAKKGADFNYFLYIVIIIVVILVVIILIVMGLIYKKKKTEEEESKRPKEIIHEILFDEDGDEGGHLPGEEPMGSDGDSEIKVKDKVVYEPELRTPGMDNDTEFGVEDESDTSEIIENETLEDTVDSEGIDETLTEGNELYDLSDGPELELELDQEVEDNELDDLEDNDELDNDFVMDSTDEQIQQHINLGEQFFNEGNFSDAIIEWQKVLDIDPEQQEIMEKIKIAMEKMK